MYIHSMKMQKQFNLRAEGSVYKNVRLNLIKPSVYLCVLLLTSLEHECKPCILHSDILGATKFSLYADCPINVLAETKYWLNTLGYWTYCGGGGMKCPIQCLIQLCMVVKGRQLQWIGALGLDLERN